MMAQLKVELTLKCLCDAWLQAGADFATVSALYQAWWPLHAASDDDPTRCRSMPAPNAEGGEP